jgi:hypothetical protein
LGVFPELDNFSMQHTQERDGELQALVLFRLLRL